MPTFATLARLLAIAAMALVLRGSAAALDFTGCCICDCPGVAAQCSGVASANDCDARLPACEQATNRTCQMRVNATACDLLPECAAGSAVAPAPSLDVTGLAVAVIVLGGLAALRLRRRPAKQRSR